MIYVVLVYLIYLLLFVVYSIAAVYHLWRFGYVGDYSKPAIVVYISLSAVITLFSLILILLMNWS